MRGGFDDAVANIYDMPESVGRGGPVTVRPGVKLVAELKFPDIAGRAAERRSRRGEPGPCYEIAFLNSAVYACNRMQHHTGRHSAGNGRIILATWRSL